MKHIVVDLEMNNIKKKSEARRICTYETIEIGTVIVEHFKEDYLDMCENIDKGSFEPISEYRKNNNIDDI